MNFRIWLVLFLISPLLMMSGCTTKETFNPLDTITYTIHPLRSLPPQVEARAKEMTKEKITKNDDTRELALFYTNNTNYVLITSGKKPTGGYSIIIERISPHKNGITIHAKDVPPEKNAMVEQVITAPLLAISIPTQIKHARILWE